MAHGVERIAISEPFLTAVIEKVNAIGPHDTAPLGVDDVVIIWPMSCQLTDSLVALFPL